MEETERTEVLLDRTVHVQPLLSTSVLRQHSPAATPFSFTGQAAAFNVSVQRTQVNSVDLYLLMAISDSMQGHLSKVQTLGSDLLQALKEITRSGHIGEVHGHRRNLSQHFPYPGQPLRHTPEAET